MQAATNPGSTEEEWGSWLSTHISQYAAYCTCYNEPLFSCTNGQCSGNKSNTASNMAANKPTSVHSDSHSCKRWACVIYPVDARDSSICALAPPHHMIWRMQPYNNCPLTTDIKITIEVLPGSSNNHNYFILDVTPHTLHEMRVSAFFEDIQHKIPTQGEPFALSNALETAMYKTIVSARALDWPSYSAETVFPWHEDIYSTETRLTMLLQLHAATSESERWRQLASKLQASINKYKALIAELEDVHYRLLWRRFQLHKVTSLLQLHMQLPTTADHRPESIDANNTPENVIPVAPDLSLTRFFQTAYAIHTTAERN